MSQLKYQNVKQLLRLYFNQPNVLYEHLFGSFHQLVEEIIPYAVSEEKNIIYESIEETMIYRHEFKCSNIRIKPVVFENNPYKYVFPSDARKNHLNYFATVYADVEQIVEKHNILTGETETKVVAKSDENDPIALANIPIMVKSKYCNTNVRKDLHGECKYDPGGYFIVNGQEKVVISIEKMVDNKPLVFSKKDSSFQKGFYYSIQINSKLNDWSDNLQILTIKEKKDGIITITTSQLADIPIVILFRALGLESDQDIISNCCYSLDDTNMINLIEPSIKSPLDEDGNVIRTKEQAINYLITKLRRNMRFSETDEELAETQKKIFLERIFRKDLLPHLSEDIPLKIRFLGKMLNKLFKVMLNRLSPDDRDALTNKRIETPGVLIGQLFRQNWKKLLLEIKLNFKKKNQSDDNPVNVITLIKPSTIEQGIKTALATGIWGMNKTKKGVAQALQRLSRFQFISLLRRVMSPSLDASTSKVISIRHVNNQQWCYLCCVETPEGAKIGVVKSLAMSSTITHQNNSQKEIIKKIIDEFGDIEHPVDIDPLKMKYWGKVYINGIWIGVTKKIIELYQELLQKRRNGVLDRFTTLAMNYLSKELNIYSDGGRLIRPVFIVKNNKLNINDEIIKDINQLYKSKETNAWNKLLSKYPNLIEYEDIETMDFLMVGESPDDIVNNKEKQSKVIKDSESDLVINRYGENRYVKYTHCDIHPWLMLGMVASSIPFTNHNYANRNIIFFSQAKQSIGIYVTNYKDRMDISQILYHPQAPLVTTEGMYINDTMRLPFGENVIVAIMSYMGYNQEDSLILNKSSVDRGLFRADTLKKYHGKIEKNPSTSQDDIFIKPDANKVTGMKQGNYDKLNEKGFIPEETIIENGDIIIGKVSPIQPTGNNNKVYKDSSEQYKNNFPGVIDRVHTEVYNNDGYEMYNVRMRSERKPIMGDKFCLTKEHQVLTNEGWKYINEINYDDLVCCLDSINDSVVYHKPLEIHKFDYNSKVDGKLYQLSNKNIELITTPNHRMWAKIKNNYDFIYAKDCYQQDITFKNTASNYSPTNWIGKRFSKFDVNINDWIKFFGNWLSDGYVSDYVVVKNNNLEQILDNMGFKFTKSKDNLLIEDESVINYMKELDKNYLPDWVWNLNQEQSKLLINSMLNKLELNNLYYGNSSLIDDLMRLCLHAGWYSKKKNENLLLIDKTNLEIEMNYEKFEKWIDYKGYVYCITIPTHIFMVRKNGKSLWTGNSNRHG